MSSVLGKVLSLVTEMVSSSSLGACEAKAAELGFAGIR